MESFIWSFMTAMACWRASSATMGGGVRLMERSVFVSTGSEGSASELSSSSVEREMMGRRFLEGGAAFFLVTLQSVFSLTYGEGGSMYVGFRGTYSLILSSEPAVVSTCGGVIADFLL